MKYEENVRISLNVDGRWHNVSSRLMAGSLTISEPWCNESYDSTQKTASFSLMRDKWLWKLITGSYDKIGVLIHDGNGHTIFNGVADPVFDDSWDDPDMDGTISMEAVCGSSLDDKLKQSVCWPQVVGGTAFHIYKRSETALSILHCLLAVQGLSDSISPDAPDILTTVSHFAATKGQSTARELINALLHDYGWCIDMLSDGHISWRKTAYDSFTEQPGKLNPSDILHSGRFKISKRYQPYDGITVSWPKTKVYDDALLWRGNLPVGDTSDPHPGDAIAAGDYWPEDSDIVETWQNFDNTYLDYDWATGASRLKNDDLELISSSDWHIKDIKDDEVALDPIGTGNTVVYEALRARLRYKNGAASAKRLYWSEIWGKALVRIQSRLTSYPEDAGSPMAIESKYVYDADAAKRLAELGWMRIRQGSFDISFSSTRKFDNGTILWTSQNNLFKGYLMITSRSRRYDTTGIWSYNAVSIETLEKLQTKTTAHSSGISTSQAQDGGTPRTAFIRANAQPATPIGDAPEGWTIGAVPDGSAPVWISIATFSSSGNITVAWTAPVRLTGKDKGSYRGSSAADITDPLDGDFYLYIGDTSDTRTQYHFYKWTSSTQTWIETTDSADRIAGMLDAMQIATQSGNVIEASAIFTDFLAVQMLVFSKSGGFRSENYIEDSDGSPRMGFKGSASDGLIRAVGLIIRNCKIINGEADFGSLKVKPGSTSQLTSSFAATGTEAKDIVTWMNNNSVSTMSPCSVVDHSEWCFINYTVTREHESVFGTQRFWYVYDLYFYNSNRTQVYRIECYTGDYSGSSNELALTISILVGGNYFWLNVPTQASGLESGRVWNDSGTLKIIS